MSFSLNNTSTNYQSLGENILNFLANLEYNSNPYYDQAYVINLDRSLDRWELTSHQLAEAGIKFVRFSAVDGYKLLIQNIATSEVIRGQKLKETTVKTEANTDYLITHYEGNSNPTEINYFGKRVSAGELGILASHVMIWKEALENGYDTIVIFEDDLALPNKSTFKEQLDNFISHLPNNFDVAFADYHQVEGMRYPIQNNDYVSAVSDDFLGWGMHAAVYSKKGMKKLLSYERYENEIDIFIWQQASYDDHDGLITYISEIDFIDVSGKSTIDAMGRADVGSHCSGLI